MLGFLHATAACVEACCVRWRWGRHHVGCSVRGETARHSTWTGVRHVGAYKNCAFVCLPLTPACWSRWGVSSHSQAQGCPRGKGHSSTVLHRSHVNIMMIWVCPFQGVSHGMHAPTVSAISSAIPLRPFVAEASSRRPSNFPACVRMHAASRLPHPATRPSHHFASSDSHTRAYGSAERRRCDAARAGTHNRKVLPYRRRRCVRVSPPPAKCPLP